MTAFDDDPADPLSPASGWAITQLLRRLYEHLDHFRYRDLADLFTADGVWHRQGRACRAHHDLVATLMQRPRDQTTRHLIQNVIVERGVTGEARVRFLNVACQGPAGAPVPPAARPLGLWDARATVRHGPDGWRVAELAQQPVFGPG